jgi:hypothetical protein
VGALRLVAGVRRDRDPEVGFVTSSKIATAATRLVLPVFFGWIVASSRTPEK